MNAPNSSTSEGIRKCLKERILDDMLGAFNSFKEEEEEENGEDFKINSEKDNQLNYAIKLFNS